MKNKKVQQKKESEIQSENVSLEEINQLSNILYLLLLLDSKQTIWHWGNWIRKDVTL